MSKKLKWDKIIKSNIVDVWGLRDLVDRDDLITCIDAAIYNIFTTLNSLKTNKFYKGRELEAIFLMINDEITNLHAILLITNNILTLPVYAIIENIFDDLIELGEHHSNYEMSGNLLRVKEWWFNYYSIKSKSNSAKQR